MSEKETGQNTTQLHESGPIEVVEAYAKLPDDVLAVGEKNNADELTPKEIIGRLRELHLKYIEVQKERKFDAQKLYNLQSEDYTRYQELLARLDTRQKRIVGSLNLKVKDMERICRLSNNLIYLKKSVFAWQDVETLHVGLWNIEAGLDEDKRKKDGVLKFFTTLKNSFFNDKAALFVKEIKYFFTEELPAYNSGHNERVRQIKELESKIEVMDNQLKYLAARALALETDTVRSSAEYLRHIKSFGTDKWLRELKEGRVMA